MKAVALLGLLLTACTGSTLCQEATTSHEALLQEAKACETDEECLLYHNLVADCLRAGTSLNADADPQAIASSWKSLEAACDHCPNIAMEAPAFLAAACRNNRCVELDEYISYACSCPDAEPVTRCLETGQSLEEIKEGELEGCNPLAGCTRPVRFVRC